MSIKCWFRPVLIAGLIVASISAIAFASGPVFWEVSKQQGVLKGDAKGVSIDENGVMTLAPSFDLVYDTKETYIWSSAMDASGNVYLGTGHEGRIFKVTPGGQGKLLYDSPELDVTALATDPQGNVYAGTSPDGKIYKITPDGASSVFYDPPDKYIWSLVFDPRTSTLYVGTGNKGIIYKVDSVGKATTLADTTETNIVSLALDKDGYLIAGTDPGGLVLRISPAGKVFAVLDTPLEEIHRVIVGQDGSIYALGINPQANASQTSKNSVGVSSTTSISSEGVITISSEDSDSSSAATSVGQDLSSVLSQTKSSGHTAEGARGALIRILPDGGNVVLWSSTDVTGFALALGSDNKVLIGTGSKGRIYSISGNRTSTLLVQSPEDQTSTLIGGGDNIYATSSNLGKLYRIGRQSVTEGTYISPVRDTKFVASWGRISWRGTGKVELQTRTGNTESPDATWSEWSAPETQSSGAQITSPKARFIQWRATLKSSGESARGGDGENVAGGTSLESVTVAYLSRNQAPEIASVSILPNGVALQEMPIAVDPSVAASGLDPSLFGVSMNVPPRRYYQKGAKSLVWQASDPNDDTLSYKIYYRAVSEKDWHLLAENLTESYYTIDGNRLPDGAYVFRIEASDAPSNPASVALTAEYVTEVVRIDNTPPVIKAGRPAVEGKKAEVEFDAADATSLIVRGEYSVDGGAWQLVYPVDGIADSASENFKFSVEFKNSGEHVIAFRCADSSSNVGTSMVSVSIH